MSAIRERLVRFYEHYNPACLPSVDSILEIYRGKEDEIFLVLTEKYGPEPVSTAGNRSVVGNSSSHDTDKDDLISRLTAALREKSQEVKELTEAMKSKNHRAGERSRTDGELQPIRNILDRERAENRRLSSLMEESQQQLHHVKQKNKQLQRKLRVSEDNVDHLNLTAERFNENELVLLREIVALKLKLGEEEYQHHYEQAVRQSEERFRHHYERRVQGMGDEMSQFYASAERQLADKDAEIRSFLGESEDSAA